MSKDFELNRKKYQEIKKMDHHDMQQYLNAVYRNGVAAGKRDAAGSFDTGIALAAISQIKGIGQVKLRQIYSALVAAGAKDIGQQLDEMEAEVKRMAAGGQDA